MAPKILFILLIWAFALHFSTSAGAKPQVIHFISALESAVDNDNDRIEVVVTARRDEKAGFELRPKQEYQLNVDDINYVYYAKATDVIVSRLASFNAYEPVRDKGKADIYLRANDKGFSISYDKRSTNWTLLAPWIVSTSQ